MSTGNIRGQRTQSSANGYKTLASSIASGNNSGCFKRIYINAFERYNGNSDLALSYTLGINKGDYAHTNSQALTTVKSASGPQVGDYTKKALIKTPQNATSLTGVYLGSTISSGLCICCPRGGAGTSSVISYTDTGNYSGYYFNKTSINNQVSYVLEENSYASNNPEFYTIYPLAIQSGQYVYFNSQSQIFGNQVVVNSGGYLYDNSTNPSTLINSYNYMKYTNSFTGGLCFITSGSTTCNGNNNSGSASAYFS